MPAPSPARRLNHNSSRRGIPFPDSTRPDTALDVWLIVFGVLVALGAVGGSVVGFLHWRASGKLHAAQTAENLTQQKDIARLSADAERLRQENLKLQSALQPRRIALMGVNGDHKVRAERLAVVKNFAGTLAIIEAVPDLEAQTLASDIKHLLERHAGWRTEVTNAVPTGLILDGVKVMTEEESPFNKDGSLSSLRISKTGEAGQAIASWLQLDLGPPRGPPLGVSWSPVYQEFRQGMTGGFVIPKGAVFIFVGMRPAPSAIVLPQTTSQPATTNPIKP